MSYPTDVRRFLRSLVVWAAVVTAIASLVSGAPAAVADTPAPNATATSDEPNTSAEPATPDGTTVASDNTYGGFTLSAAILAVLVAGSYRYLRR